MLWILVPLAALTLAGWFGWLEHRKERSKVDGNLLERINQNELALQSAKKRIENLETIVVHSLEEGGSESTSLIADEDSAESFPARAARAPE